MTNKQKEQVSYLAVLIETLDAAPQDFATPESILYMGLQTAGVSSFEYQRLVGGLLGGGLADRVGAHRLQITDKGREVAAKIRNARNAEGAN